MSNPDGFIVTELTLHTLQKSDPQYEKQWGFGKIIHAIRVNLEKIAENHNVLFFRIRFLSSEGWQLNYAIAGRPEVEWFTLGRDIISAVKALELHIVENLL